MYNRESKGNALASSLSPFRIYSLLCCVVGGPDLKSPREAPEIYSGMFVPKF
jgi:hypothetical protein